MESWIQDIRWFRYPTGAPVHHPSGIPQAGSDGRISMVLQIRVEGEWTDIPVLDAGVEIWQRKTVDKS